MANTTFNSLEYMIRKLQLLISKTTFKFYKNVSNYYDEMNIRRRSGSFQFEEDPSSKNVHGIGNFYH